ncbi:M24 family metallopeptidase [Bacillus haynesii]|uniref:M24 family metallopeptidase n=1 Tax=Bacillus haynesii TaxID=1925021 RepID=UPI0015945479|nr:Xaa-Pro peptidase family protein [Bacillus haynesii]NVB33644.1 aminopeptidase P family protein [Bacillus licheniformis]MCY7781182.1 Xaa-Pro peptidase family protein [Bacillus haynesii]MCY8369676.1 Xaa-Pro peptidase family protein [Bacillus haynesii]MCY8672780.1 Xaa-Pro peptidase family protein [Bacillus haynesii]MEC0671925.1 Xaa-Pro peptidase family protein [Bacillus haynesii]
MERIEQISSWLKEKNISSAFIHSKENVFYLTGFYTEPHERLMGVFIFQDEEPFFVCPQMEAGQARAAGWAYEIIGYGDHENPWELISSALQKRNGQCSKVAVEKETLALSRAEMLQAVTNGAELVSAEERLNQIRVIKDEKEISILREAAKLADYGVEAGAAALKEGIAEIDVVAKIEYELKKKGVQGMSFSTMVLFGEKSGQPHGNPGRRTLKPGDFVLFDLGVIIDGYCSDITRTLVYQNVSEKQKEIYNTVLQAETEALKMSKPGVRIGDLDLKARGIIEKAGYGDYFPHRLGHGLGISPHEYPSMSHNNDELLKQGMVYTIEPGIYVPEIGGVRIEDDVLVTADGAEALTKYPKQLTVIS